MAEMNTHPQIENRILSDKFDLESRMPLIPSRFPPIKDTLSSYLGQYNPFASPLDPATSTVWLFDNTAAKESRFSRHYTATFIGAFFLKDSGKNVGKIVADIAEKLGIAGREEEERRIRERLQPFMDAVMPAKTVRISIEGEKGAFKLGPSGRDGISRDVLTLSGHSNNSSVVSHALLGSDVDKQDRNMRTFFAEADGWGVISDVDDTIKTTLTPQPLGILRTTFVDIPAAIPGMPTLYQHLVTKLNPTWFYLSASPYNLYPFLHTFINQTYPPGTLLLRNASWMDVAGFLASLTSGTQAYKVGEMDKLHALLPHRKMLCIGDSTQSDPEAYAEVYRKYDGWVRRIFIRRVTDVPETNAAGKNEDSRFEQAFKGVPRSVWTIFERPEELAALVDQL